MIAEEPLLKPSFPPPVITDAPHAALTLTDHAHVVRLDPIRTQTGREMAEEEEEAADVAAGLVVRRLEAGEVAAAHKLEALSYPEVSQSTRVSILSCVHVGIDRSTHGFDRIWHT